jgi:hypothetical protein
MMERIRGKSGWVFAVGVVLLLVLIFGFIIYLLFFEPSGFKLGAGVEEASVSGDSVYLKLSEEEEDPIVNTVVFTDKGGKKYYYEFEEGAGEVEVDLSDIGIDDVDDVEKIEVVSEEPPVLNDSVVNETVDEQPVEEPADGEPVDDVPVIDAPVFMGTEISQYGITWRFDGEVEYGQFVSGDYWVVGPVRVLSKSPAPEVVSGYYIHGSMVNPWKDVQGYDARGRIFDRSVVTEFPYDMSPGESLVSTVSVLPIGFSNWDGVSRGRVTDAAVLTCLDSVPAEGSFRPPYAGTDKTVRHNKNDLDYSILGRLAPLSNTPRLEMEVGDEQITDLDGYGAIYGTSVERLFERPWIDHAFQFLAQELHPWHNMRDYGRDISEQVGIGALMLNMDYSDAEKEDLMISMVQLGIDNYGIVGARDGIDAFEAAGGHSGYRKFPLFLAAYALDDADMKDVIARSGEYLYSGGHGAGNAPSDYVWFGADDQVFYVKQEDVDFADSWSCGHCSMHPDARDCGFVDNCDCPAGATCSNWLQYESSDIGLPEWGIVHARGPRQSNKYWGTAYRPTTANSWAGWVLAVHAMGLKTEWNNDALFDYQDRYMWVTSSSGPNAEWRGHFRQQDRWTTDMWDTYRSGLGCVWTADDLSSEYSGGSCI